MDNKFKRVIASALAVTMGLTLAACQKTEQQGDKKVDDKAKQSSVVLYTSSSAAEYECVVREFNKKYPDIKVEIVSAGTGEIASRIKAEKDAPYGDVIMGGGATVYKGIKDCLEPYKTSEIDNLFSEFIPEDNLFTPTYITVNSIIVNKKLIADLGVKVEGWASLLDEKLKGKIAFANPADSGSALEAIVNMLGAMKTNDDLMSGWDYVSKFVSNLDHKFASGSSGAYKTVVEGEYPVGICNEDKTISYMNQGADVYAVYPKEGVTLRTSNIGLIKNGKNPDNAKKFIDFVVSKECQTATEKEVNIRPMRKDVQLTTKGRLSTAELKSIAYPKVKSKEIKAKFQQVVVDAK